MKVKKIAEVPIQITDSTTGYKKKIILKKFQLKDGIIETFFIDKNKDSVQILPITTDNQIVTILQFRPNFEREECELPGGTLEENEDPILGAERELLEETGYKGNLFHVSSMPYSPYSTGIRHFFVATDCIKIKKQNLDPGEFIKIKIWDMLSFRNEIMNGRIRGGNDAYMAFDKLRIL